MLEIIFFSHLIGDYLFQTDWMASNKQNKTLLGTWACLIHCFVYAMVLTIGFSFIGQLSWKIFAIGFLSHYPIDRLGLGAKWMKLMGQIPPSEIFMIEDFTKRETRKMFSPIVYVVVDNTFHLLLMRIAISFV